MKLRCLIVDDEPLARQGLGNYVAQIEFLELVASCKNALQANGLIAQEKIDLLFLDIEMPQLSGLELLRSMDKPPFVIFTTAYPNYALEGYQFDVIDYLVKPISFERFLQASNKALRLIPIENQDATAEEAPFIFVKKDTQLIKVLIEDILYIEGMQNYIQINTNQERITTLVPLKSVFDMLPESQFLQVHRSFIIAKDKVEAIVDHHLQIGPHRIPISVRLRKQVLEELTKNRMWRK